MRGAPGDMSDLPETFVAYVAHELNSAGIRCVLCGHDLLNVHGVPLIIGVGVWVERHLEVGLLSKLVSRLRHSRSLIAQGCRCSRSIWASIDMYGS